MFDLREEQERVILVGVQENGGANAEESLDELAELASTAGAKVEGRLVQVREAIHPGTYIGKGKLEELRTNMLLIQAKAKEYVEDANFRMGLAPDETRKEEVRRSVYVDGAKLEKVNAQEYGIDNSSVCYKVTKETLNIWGLDKIELKDNEDYLIAFDDENATVEIYNTKGFVDDNGDTRNSLTDIEEIR